MNTTDQGPSRHNNNFGFLRLCFASLVILAHSPEIVDGNRDRELLSRVFHTLSFGELAVAGFFILSGYLIVQSWERDPNVLRYLQKRVLRIYPGFIVASLFSGLVFGPLGAENPATYFAQFNSVSFAGSTLSLWVPTIPSTQVGNNSLWTVRWEFVCYVLVLGLGLAPSALRRWLPLILLGSMFVFFIERRYVSNPWILFAFFLAGASFHHFQKQVPLDARGALVAGAGLVACMFHPLLSWIAMATLGAYLIFYCAFARSPMLRRVGERVDISYGTYLYAWPIQSLLVHRAPGISPWLVFALAWPLSMACGWLSWHLVEHPFLKLKKRSTPAPAGPATAAPITSEVP